MCGIVGYVGLKSPINVLVSGLEKLEYRGYDSAGVAIIRDKDNFEVVRAEGKLINLSTKLKSQGLLKDEKEASDENSTSTNKEIHVGIGHTRWATHGKPSMQNAHPHVAGSVCLVHNGIIENFEQLKKELQSKGRKFESDTDTEVIAHLIDQEIIEGKNFFTAFVHTIKRLKGSYAIVAMSVKDPNKLLVAKNSSPVVIGFTAEGNFVASDIPAILEYTRDVIILEEGDLALIEKDKVEVFNLPNVDQKITRPRVKISWDPVTAQKGGYRHFLLKEINDQPQVIADTFRGRMDLENAAIQLDGLNFSDKELKEVEKITIVACGTAYYAGLITKHYIEKFAKIPVEVDFASEFTYRDPLIQKNTLAIAISQSGETIDTLGALKYAKDKGAKSLAICNVIGSSISRLAGNVIYTHAGPEISVCSTKAFVTQVTVAYLLALKLADIKGLISKEELKANMQALLHTPTLVAKAISYQDTIDKLAKQFSKSSGFLFLGKGILYPIALEGALKLKELSYVWAQGYPSGEMKHGPISLIDEQTPVIFLLGHDGVNYEKALSNMKQVQSRGGKIIVVCDTATKEVEELAMEVISLGEVNPSLLPIALTVPLQLLAYFVAVHRGTDVDQPRNLAKSVTVE